MTRRLAEPNYRGYHTRSYGDHAAFRIGNLLDKCLFS